MIGLLARLYRHAAAAPRRPALADECGTMTYAALQREVTRLATLLAGRRVGVMGGNGIPWVVLDLALQARGAVAVPMPPFFTDAQLLHLIGDAGLDTIITDRPERIEALLRTPPQVRLFVAGRRLSCFGAGPVFAAPLPAGTAKVTYTSGSTGTPKGVCLSDTAMERVAQSLCRAVGAGPKDRSLSLLPLSTLLENIAVSAALDSGACACVPDLCEGGIGGTAVDADKLIALLHRWRPTSIVLVPQLLKLMVEAMEAGRTLPASLRFAAVGGAPVSEQLMARARAVGLPAYQGYGLSEAASVVSLNVPGAARPGSVGRPLPHVKVRIADDGEIMVRGEVSQGYLGETAGARRECATGDLGYLDDDGFLYVSGRKKSAYATALGRNVAPEWVESELMSHPAVAQAVVCGEGRPFNVAVLVPRSAAAAAQLTAAVGEANQRLPDYARVACWVMAEEPFTPRNGQANGAGVVQRRAVESRYAARLAACYESERSYGVL